MDRILKLARKELLDLAPYSSARSEAGDLHSSNSLVFLDANESPFSVHNYNRYPDPQPKDLVLRMSQYYGVAAKNILVTRGSDEGIDLLIRAFCRAGIDGILQCPPTYGCYSVFANIQNAFIKNVPLNESMDLDLDAVLHEKNENIKLLFLCSPNNPTGNLLNRDRILKICESFAETSLIVVDEAYLEFSGQTSISEYLEKYSNLVILRTLSKAHALAGIRCGAVLANEPIISLLKKIIAPYPLPSPVIKIALKAFSASGLVIAEENVKVILREKERIKNLILKHKMVKKQYHSDSNFILIETTNADEFMKLCKNNGLILRNRSKDLENAVRITIGSEYENNLLLKTLGLISMNELTEERVATVVRETTETSITVKVNLDRKEPISINTGIGFFDHMLEQLAKHGGFSLNLYCKGDISVDDHHSIEDCALALGQAIREALGDKKGINRYGFVLPMDDAECNVSLDLSGRSYLKLKGKLPEMVTHFMRSFSDELGATLHISVTGDNIHHKAEACFKCLGRVLKVALSRTGTDIPSTKGIL